MDETYRENHPETAGTVAERGVLQKESPAQGRGEWYQGMHAEPCAPIFRDSHTGGLPVWQPDYLIAAYAVGCSRIIFSRA